jgi:glycosyltransferase involved in cell wall biosynthesis
MVSIIMPIYNAYPYVKYSLFSVLNQTYSDLEILVIDDGSTDGSFEYLNEIIDNRLYVYKNDKKGACSARNFGLKKAKGDFIQFLDADDILSLDKIEKQVYLLQKYPNRVAVCSTVHFYEDHLNGTITDRKFLYSTDNAYDFLLKLYGANGCDFDMISPNAWLTPKKIVEKAGFWDEELIKDQDGEYFCRVVMASDGICFEPKAFSYYRKYLKGNSISSGKTKSHILSQLSSIESKEHQLITHKHSEKFKVAFALQYKLIAIESYPQFLDIYKKALHKSKSLKKLDYLPNLGGRVIEIIKKFFGWRAAKSLSYFIHNQRLFRIFLK